MAQTSGSVRYKAVSDISFLLQQLSDAHCQEDLPAPTVRVEPNFTQGSANEICFELPPSEAIPAFDSVRVQFVEIQYYSGGDTARVPVFPVVPDSLYRETLPALLPGQEHTYTAALFIAECEDEACDNVILHCSSNRDTVRSLQDDRAPITRDVAIPELDDAPVPQWLNRSQFQVESEIADSAGVQQAFLYRRVCSDTGWNTVVDSITFQATSTEFEARFSPTADVSFPQDLPDGCYEFRVGGKDAAYTPASCEPDFTLAGNVGLPGPDDFAQVSIHVDTTPPSTVEVTCTQQMNVIQLDWQQSIDSVPGIGLAGYRIFRDETVLATVPASETGFSDPIPLSTPETEFVYRIAPFDSLGNVQADGGTANCLYVPVTRISMLPEPEFTAGTANEVCWTGSPNIDSYSVFIAPDCDVTAAVENVMADTCETFSGLLDGTDYCYWVTAVDRQGREVFSDTVSSMQDASAPEITFFDVEQRVQLDGVDWVNTRDLSLRLIAEDPGPGQISEIVIRENGQAGKNEGLTPESKVDTNVNYTLSAAECTPATVAVQVIDAAGNQSEMRSLDIKLDATPPAAVTVANCSQLQGESGILLEWTPSEEPAECSGLTAYQVFRGEDSVATVMPGVLSFEDLLPADTPDTQFTYQIRPVDALGNVQTEGGTGVCDYAGASFITIEAMDKFTPGLQNEVCWQISGDLASAEVFIDGDGGRASQTFANPAASQCHTFTNLADGRRYFYWVVGVDAQQRTAVSDTVWSIQDATSPQILGFSFPDGEQVNDQVWTHSREIDVRVRARDVPPGELMSYRIEENDLPPQQGSFTDSVSAFDGTLPYELQSVSPPANRIDLRLTVEDGAGNASRSETVTIFLQEDAPNLFAFPSPFNPMRERPVTIRVRNENETEVKIYDFFGNLVTTVREKANDHDFIWDGKNEGGEMVANGGYLCIGTQTKSRFKLAVIKN